MDSKRSFVRYISHEIRTPLSTGTNALFIYFIHFIYFILFLIFLYCAYSYSHFYVLVMMGLDLLASDLDDQNSMPIGAPLRRPLSITRRKGENPVQSEDRHCETVSPSPYMPA